MSKLVAPLSNSSICGSSFDVNNKCNYDCPNCQKTGKEPNIAGRFFIINDTECKCNACDTVFPKEQFYKPVVEGNPVVGGNPVVEGGPVVEKSGI